MDWAWALPTPCLCSLPLPNPQSLEGGVVHSAPPELSWDIKGTQKAFAGHGVRTGRTRCSKRLGVWARKYHKKRKDQKQNQTESQAGDDKVSRQRFYLLGGGRGDTQHVAGGTIGLSVLCS